MSGSDPPPEQFGRYRILKELGRGAMGAVYLAHDEQLDREVALKIPQFRKGTGLELLARFQREARAAAQLRHPGICPVFDVGELDGQHYITMAFIKGRPLNDVTDAGKAQGVRQSARVIRKLAQALAVAHQHGVVHRDLKPANVMIDERKEPVVMDFGLAQRTAGNEEKLTQDGTFMGTPAYMSPEQVNGETDRIGPASDIYSLGVIFYELLTGQLPFQGSVVSIIRQIVTTSPQPPTELRAEVPAELESICLRMMSRDLGDRFESMEQVVASLGAFLKQSGTSTRDTVPPRSVATPRRSDGKRKTRLGASIVGALLLIAGIAFLMPGDDDPPPPPRGPAVAIGTPDEDGSSDSDAANSDAADSDTPDDNVSVSLPATDDTQEQSLADILTSPDCEWSEPESLDWEVNLGPYNYAPWLSDDGLELWYPVNLGPTKGHGEIHVARRESIDAIWQTPIRLGSPINTEHKERRATLSSDRCEFVLRRSTGLFSTTRPDPESDWAEPQLFDGAASGGVYPVLSGDGLTLFVALRPSQADPSSESTGTETSIYVLKREDRQSPWSEPLQPQGQLNSPAYDYPAWLSADERLLLLFSEREGGIGDSDLWFAAREAPDQPWEAPVNLGPVINTDRGEFCGALTPDGRTLIFAAKREGQRHYTQLYSSNRISR